MNKLLVVVGTRPNFIKIVQFKHYAALYNFDLRIVHTGQHYDENLSDVFFQQLGITPDYLLDTRTSNPEMQLNIIKARLNHFLNNTYKPDLMLVVGDVTSTRAAAETAQILSIPLAHVESGLRSFDQSMPEEINRIVTDNLSDYFFITEQSGIDNLKEEGISKTDKPDELWNDVRILTTSGGRTDVMLTPKKGAPIDIGKMAMWRIRFGDCSWISDYKDNYKEQDTLQEKIRCNSFECKYQNCNRNAHHNGY